MSKHTPGPWAYTVDAHGDDLQITAGEQTVVGGCGCCGSPSMDNPADAPLLAAAPDLLSVLKDVLSTWDSGSEAFPISDIRAVIAKAEGKS